MAFSTRFLTTADPLKGKTVLVTGGTGSFGQAFTKYVLESCAVKKLIVFSRDELKQFEMSKIYSENQYPQIRYFIGDIRDKDRLYRALADVDIVVHTAALKQVPTAEYNPFETIKTNVVGTQNLIEAAIDCGVQRVVALSTDKAVNPINLYGATKLCSDKLVVSANNYANREKTKFSVVRYGNVVGSRGSVIPFFLKERKKGVLPITDIRMTRFWITIEEGLQFVLFALANMIGGELFVPKIPSMKIVDLAAVIAPEAEILEVGIRPGEKLHELLISQDDASNTLEFSEHYIVQPTINWWKSEKYIQKYGGQSVDPNFEFSSKNNPHWLQPQQLVEVIRRQFGIELRENHISIGS